MRQFILGFITALALSASLAWAQGVMIAPSNEPGMTIFSTPEGYGNVLNFGGGMSSYTLPNGQHGTIQNIPGGSRTPC